jgi:phytoene/squalene synthetase
MHRAPACQFLRDDGGLGEGERYLPLDVLARHGSSVEDIANRCRLGVRAAMREAVDHCPHLFLEGLPLARMVDRRWPSISSCSAAACAF